MDAAAAEFAAQPACDLGDLVEGRRRGFPSREIALIVDPKTDQDKRLCERVLQVPALSGDPIGR